MTLEFEKIAADVEAMALTTMERRAEGHQILDEALEKLQKHATDWEGISRCLELALARVEVKRYRAAAPLEEEEPLDVAVSPSSLPVKATIVAADGSQVLPNRHASFLYSLINIGVIVYFHGSDQVPEQFTLPALDYPGKSPRRFIESGTIVGIRRDRAEIETLARVAWDFRGEERPLLIILDQRLLYSPIIGISGGEGEEISQAWQDAMTAIRQTGGLLTGYIANPLKNSILTMLNTLDIEEPGFDLRRLTQSDATLGLTDARLFRLILGPGQRSKVFVDVSRQNDDFVANDPENQVCFFYLNPGRSGRQIARVDIPISLAREPAAVDAVHALIYDQCRILGDYPYALTRADEIAVVGRRDQENLDVMISNSMQRLGIGGLETAKQSTKSIARAGKTRHEV
jgi:hypothetical protein